MATIVAVLVVIAFVILGFLFSTGIDAIKPEEDVVGEGEWDNGLMVKSKCRPEVLRRFKQLMEISKFRKGLMIVRSTRSDVEALRKMRTAWLIHIKGKTVPSRPEVKMDEVPFWDKLKATEYLDIGSGDGAVTNAIVERLGLSKDKAFACDIQDESKQTDITSVRCDELPEEKFDVITMFASAHHFRDAPKMFADAFRAMKPGGYLLMREFGHGRVSTSTTRLWLNEDSDPIIFYDLAHAFFEMCDGRDAQSWVEQYHREGPMMYQYRDADGWSEIATKAGFKEIARKSVGGLFDIIYLLFRKETTQIEPGHLS